MDELLIINLIAISTAVIGCAAASVTDLKTKLIPNKIPFVMLGLSVPLALLRFYFIGQDFVILWILNFTCAFVLAILLWNMRAWAGGDAKMFWAVIALIPVYPETLIDTGMNLSTILASHFSYNISPGMTVTPQLLPPYMSLTFMVTFFLNFGILLLTKFLFAAMFKAVHERKLLVFLRLILTPFLFVFSAVAFAAGLAAAANTGFLVYSAIIVILILSGLGKNNYLYSFILAFILLFAGLVMCNVSDIESFIAFTKTRISIIFFVFLISAYSVGKMSERTRNIKIDKLEEGMSLAEKIYLKKGEMIREKGSIGMKETLKLWIKKAKNTGEGFKPEKTNEEIEIVAFPAPMGLLNEDIERLKRYKTKLNNKIKIHIGVELMPFMLLALLISLFIGDLMWLFLYLGRI